MLYGGFAAAGATDGLEGFVTAAKIICMLEIGSRIHDYGVKRGYLPYYEPKFITSYKSKERDN